MIKVVEGKVYLGDGVYAAWEHDGVTLTTENGISATNTIVLETEVLGSFCRYLLHLGFLKVNENDSE